MDNTCCPKNCKHHQEVQIDRRWFQGKEEWTGFCQKFQRLILCYDLGIDGRGAKFKKTQRCLKENANPKTKY